MNNQYYILLKSDFIKSTCVPECPLECKLIEYKAFKSSYEIVGSLYYDYINSNQNLSSDFVNTNLTVQGARDGFTFFLLYYNSNSYSVLNETPSMDVVSLLADIGGTLSLFLGLSIFHFCEFFEFLRKWKFQCKT